MAIASGLSLIMPFITQMLIDYGVNGKNIDIIYLVLYAQLFLFIGSLAMQFIQNWLVLHINTRISLHIVSDFLIKLLNLPIRYFDSKTAGDITQRINDHKKIEEFLTNSSINTFFSSINIVVLSIVLGYYSIHIVAGFWIFTAASVSWVFLFHKKRRNLNYRQFKLNKNNNDLLNEIIFGMQEIKLNGAEKSKRSAWENLQINVFKVNMKGLSIEQYQRAGYVFLNQLKNILITFVAAKAVLNGQLTLGMLLSISYILGQTSGPIDQLVSFIKSAQDASLSIKRMNEIHSLKNEEDIKLLDVNIVGKTYNGDIEINDLSFQYEGPKSKFVLKNINVILKKGTVTAIVGESGSGKTTLLKLLLGYYNPTSGNIHINRMNLEDLNPQLWRAQCGVIMQDGYIFTDSIAGNITLGDEEIDISRMELAVSISNVNTFVGEKPLGYNTKIGPSGVGLSGGQKQRILIARAIYKDPNYIFLDEATSNLDANNERNIMDKLETFFINRTVVIIAHRLSTVKNADQIIVLDGGQIVEVGNHFNLVSKKGYYYELIKNQLELSA
jgi:ABC-type bacteriocin/lantibiotic exporters, contain an N-terminal double-glycine peptidase domain